MLDSTTITIRVSAELRAKLDRLAKVADRSRSYLAAQALERYVAEELAIVEGVLEGLADDEAGRMISGVEAMDRLDAAIEKATTARRSA